jgi:hypothetical protein
MQVSVRAANKAARRAIMERWASELTVYCRELSASRFIAPLAILLSVALLGGLVVNAPIAQAAVGDLVIFFGYLRTGLRP